MPTKKIVAKKSDAEEVEIFMKKLKHPMLAEIDLIRTLIKDTDPNIQERIKWNAPSYYVGTEDIVTFNPRATQHVHLVFHHPAIEKLKSKILEGEYKGRRMTYFSNLSDVKKKKKELQTVIKELIKHIRKKK